MSTPSQSCTPDTVNEEIEARQCFARGYKAASIINNGGFSKRVRYLAKLCKPNEPDKLVWLSREFVLCHEKLLLLKHEYQNRRHAKYIRSTSTKARPKSGGMRPAAITQSSEDEAALDLIQQGYVMEKVTDCRGLRTQTQYLTTLGLPDQPDAPKKSFWLSRMAYRTDHEKYLLETFRLLRQRQRGAISRSMNAKESKGGKGIEGRMREPDTRSSCGVRPAAIMQSSEDQAALEFIQQGYAMEQVTDCRGLRLQTQYLTILGLPDQPDASKKSFWLSRMAYRTDHEKQLLETFRVLRQKQHISKYKMNAKKREKAEEDKEADGKIRVSDAISSCGVRPATITQSSEDEAALDLIQQGYVMEQVTDCRGLRTQTQYLTTLGLPDHPDAPKKSFWLSRTAYHTDHEKLLLETFRFLRQKNNTRYNKKTKRSKGAEGGKKSEGDEEADGKIRVPDASCSSGLRLVPAEEAVKRQGSLARTAVENNGTKVIEETSSLGAKRPAQDFGCQVTESDLGLRREFASQTSLTYFVWDTACQ